MRDILALDNVSLCPLQIAKTKEYCDQFLLDTTTMPVLGEPVFHPKTMMAYRVRDVLFGEDTIEVVLGITRDKVMIVPLNQVRGLIPIDLNFRLN